MIACLIIHSRSNLLTTWFAARQVWCGWLKAQHRYSARFAAMLQDKLHVFCCPFFRIFKQQRFSWTHVKRKWDFFPLFSCLDTTKFVWLSVRTLETICPKVCSKSRLKCAESPLPIDVRRWHTDYVLLIFFYVLSNLVRSFENVCDIILD